MYIFADSAGTLDNPAERSMVVTAVLFSLNMKKEAYTRCESIKSKAISWGANPEYFEFHSHQMLNGLGSWKSVPSEKRFLIAGMLRRAIHVSTLPYIVVKIDKNQGGLANLERFSHQLKHAISEELKKLPPDQLKRGDKEATKLMGNKGFGLLGSCYNLLFGLASGLLCWDDYPVDAQIIADDNFLKRAPVWNRIFRLNKLAWPELKNQYKFPTWPKEKQPDWRILNNAIEEKSYNEFGLQIADYISFTLTQTHKPRFDVTYSPFPPCELRQFLDFPGILLGINRAPKPQVRSRYIHDKAHRAKGYILKDFGGKNHPSTGR